MHYGAVRLKGQLTPEEKPVRVNSHYQTGLDIASGASQKAVQVSGFLGEF